MRFRLCGRLFTICCCAVVLGSAARLDAATGPSPVSASGAAPSTASGSRARGRGTARPGRQWALLAPGATGAEGTATVTAYAMGLTPPREPIVVAVIDSGFQLDHPDLAEALWRNQREANGKPGVDDDGNGYIDDVYGWNFLGSATGAQVIGARLEVVRSYARLTRAKAKAPLSPGDAALLAKLAAQVEPRAAAAKRLVAASASRSAAFDALVPRLIAAGAAGNSMREFAQLPPALAQEASRVLGSQAGSGVPYAQLRARLAGLPVEVAYHWNPDFEESTIIGDDPADADQTGYGNPLVDVGDAALHGTHVAGIIGAVRNNGIGIDGQCAYVRLMCLRAVPDGDERDKDIANAVRYAVSQGARIINMSFGKPLSPDKAVVDAAMRFAEERGVLLVHASGNDGQDVDRTPSFPRRLLLNGSELGNWLEVGASDPRGLPTSFSNYGKTTVDLFAPGIDIASTAPGSTYLSSQGTSMAAPEVAGVAALVWSQFPALTPAELRAVLMHTARRKPGLMAPLPGGKSRVAFADLSISGGLVDAAAAIRFLREHAGAVPAGLSLRGPASATSATQPGSATRAP